MRIAVILARGGSKRIPRKNIKPFCGRPMIARPIEAALTSGCFEQVIVSTDDEEVAEISQRCGAAIPFMRPKHLADDYTPTVAVTAHALGWFRHQGCHLEWACCIYAASPFVRPSDIQAGWERVRDTACNYVFPVTSYAYPIQRALRVKISGRVEMFDSENVSTRSQDFEEAYHDAGQFYWGSAGTWLEEKPIITPDSVSFIIPRHRVQDIDTPEDWYRAELMFQALQQSD